MKRLSLLDTLKLRTSAVYRNPRDISILNIVYGDLSQVTIPCTAIDKSGYTYHVSDKPMQSITRVYVDDKPANYGYRTHTAYQDETGRSIACVVFSNPQYGQKVSVSGKGAMKLDTGELIENPADVIRDVLLDVQGYDAASIDAQSIADFYSACLKQEIKVACLLDSAITLKVLFDEIVLNIHAHWLISDGKSIMRLRQTDTAAPVRYGFSDVNDLSMEAEDLTNEITINYAYDYGEQKYKSSLTKHNTLSKIIYGDSKKTLDLRMIQHTRQAEKIADAMIRTYSIPQIIAVYKHNFKSLHIEAGDRVALTDPAGIGSSGYVEAPGIVTKKNISGVGIDYTVEMEGSGALYKSELLTLAQTAGAGKLGVNIEYSAGVATVTVFADSQGNPAVPGAKITINGIVKTTNAAGKAYYPLTNGTYTAIIEASGYEKTGMTFAV